MGYVIVTLGLVAPAGRLVEFMVAVRCGLTGIDRRLDMREVWGAENHESLDTHSSVHAETVERETQIYPWEVFANRDHAGRPAMREFGRGIVGSLGLTSIRA
jgi:hypothetical protein